MATGIVKFWKEDAGWGFITPSAGGKDIFVHHSALVKNGCGRVTLNEGEEVEFQVEQGKKGPQAINVQVVSRSRHG